MANHQNSKNLAELWFGRKIKKLIRDKYLPDNEKVVSSASDVDVQPIHDLESLQTNLEQIERNQFEFFKDPFDFHVADPLASELVSTVLPELEFPAEVEVSSKGIKVRTQSSKPMIEILLGNPDTLYFPFPSEANKESYVFRKSATSVLLHSFSNKAIIIKIPDNQDINGIIKVDIHSDFHDALVPLHLITIMGKSARANLMINIISSENNFSRNLVLVQSDSLLGDNAELSIFRHQNLNTNSLIMVDDGIVLGRSSRAGLFNYDEGAKGLNSEISLSLNGEAAEASITGVYRPQETCRYFYDTEQIHAASYSESDLLYDGVIGESAYASWKGNIVVEKGTKGTNGYQANNNLIIHDSGKVESVPGLEIITDDVRCSHGVTIGNIDKNHMFYLQSRGIKEEEAEALIVNGFLQSSLSRIKTDVFNNQISKIFDV